MLWKNKKKILNAILDDLIKSSAQKITIRLQQQGVARKEIRAKHLQEIYNGLRPQHNVVDFDSIKSMVTQLRHSDDSAQHPLWGVIIETREHPALAFVIDNISNRLGIPVQLFHTAENRKFIYNSSISEIIDPQKVVLTQMHIDHMLSPQYNALLLSPDFWLAVRGRNKLLIFQTDALLCSASDYSINKFMNFDYIGSNWPRQRPVGLVMDGGCGGLSLRDWGKTLECLQRFPAYNWPGGEDGYFAFHMDLIGAKVGRSLDCAKFGTQNAFLFHSFGLHQISCLDSQEKADFLRYCPEAKRLL